MEKVEETTAAEAASKPEKHVRHLEHRGAPINRRLAGRAESLVRDTARAAREVLDGTIPERVARDGMRIVKTRARRRDRVGEATYRALELVHDGLGTAARALNRLEEATQPPARPSEGHGRSASEKAKPKSTGRKTA
jgi:hypothetical protein